MKKSGVIEIVEYSLKSLMKYPILMAPNLLILLSIFLGVAFGALILIATGFLTTDFQFNASPSLQLTLTLLAELALAVVLVIVIVYLSVGLLGIALQVIHNKKPKLEDVMQYGKKFAWRYVLVNLTLLALFGLALLLSMLIFLTSTPFVEVNSLVSEVIVAILTAGVFLFAAFFSLAPHYLVIENKGVFDSIKKSFNVSRKNYLNLLGLLLVFLALSLLLEQVPYLGELIVLIVVGAGQSVALMKFALERR